jgi:hypothetical protein
MSAEDFTLLRDVSFIPCIIALQVFLWVILCREWVKRDLREKMCNIIRIRWRPFGGSRLFCSFRVDFSDLSGQIHRAICSTYWHRRSVTWDDDTIVGYSPEDDYTS